MMMRRSKSTNWKAYRYNQSEFAIANVIFFKSQANILTFDAIDKYVMHILAMKFHYSIHRHFYNIYPMNR